MRRRQGLSLLEIQVAMLLLLLVTLYLMSLFASGQRHGRRAVDYSLGTLLAQQRLEEARQVPLSELNSGTIEEQAPYAGFQTRIRAHPYEGSLFQLEVEVRAPSGSLARAMTLIPDPSHFRGVICDAFSHEVAWVDGDQLRTWNDSTGTVQSLGAAPDGRGPAGLAGQPGSNLLWRGAPMGGPIPFLESLPNPRTWGTALASPVATPGPLLPSARLTGITSDSFGNQLAVADTSNRGLWFARGGSWLSPQVVRPQSPPLGRPASLVSDPAMSLIWVADQDNQCLRKLISSEASSLYPASQLESAGSWGNWHRTQFRPPPTLGFGSPVGLAMDPQGWGLYVHDKARLYRFLDHADQWELLGSFPPALIDEGPSGMATDRFGHRLYLTTWRGSLWKVRSGSALTPGDFQKLWP